DRFERLDDVGPDPADVRYVGILPDPNPTVDPGSEMLRELAEDVAVDLRPGSAGGDADTHVLRGERRLKEGRPASRASEARRFILFFSRVGHRMHPIDHGVAIRFAWLDERR